MIVNKYNKGNGGGGSGSTYSAGEYISIENDVISVTGITPSEYLTTADTQDFATEADITAATQDFATEAYVDSAITSATQDFATEADITAATSPIQEQVDDIERVTATALTELHDSILELSGATSGYATEAYVDAAITSATQDFVTEEDLTGYTSQQDFEDFQDELSVKEEVIASAITELHDSISEKADAANVSGRSTGYYFPYYNEQGVITGDTRVYKTTLTIHMSDSSVSSANLFKDDNYGIPGIYVATKPGTAGQIAKSDGYGFTWANDDKVSSTSISNIVALTQAQYDALAVKDPNTFYIIKSS